MQCGMLYVNISEKMYLMIRKTWREGKEGREGFR